MIQRDEDAMVMPTKSHGMGIMNEQAAVDYYELMTGADTKRSDLYWLIMVYLGQALIALSDDGLLRSNAHGWRSCRIP